MRRHTFFVVPVAIAFAGAAFCEPSRTVRATLAPVPNSRFSVENLAGRMAVVPDEGAEVVAVATVHGETAELADGVRFEQVRGQDGEAALRVRYPLGSHRTLRYPGARGGSTVDYDGKSERVSGSSGVPVCADVEVRVPPSAVNAAFRSMVGSLTAEGIAGTILLDTASADIVARALQGVIRADAGSGEVRVERIRGSLTCDTGSGDRGVTGFDGEELSLDTGSGGVLAHDVRASRASADTGSGSVSIGAADVEDLLADTGSGKVRVELAGSRPRPIQADTGSGDISISPSGGH